MENKTSLPSNVSGESRVPPVSRKSAIKEIRNGMAVGVIASQSKHQMVHNPDEKNILTPKIQPLENAADSQSEEDLQKKAA